MLTLIALSAALIQTPPPPPGPPVEVHSRFVFVGAGGGGPGTLDADNDGQVTREEFAAPLNDAFSKMDKDGDGRLSREELAANLGGGDDARVTLHRLGGGDVERFELRRPGSDGAGAPRIERDGERTMIFVTPDGDRPNSRVVVRSRPGGPTPRMIQLDRGPDGARPARIEFRTSDRQGPADLDKDGDGKISEAEFTAPLREAFARMDADHSGFVEAGEQEGADTVQVFTRRIEHDDGE